jgi:hypothetical protein
MYKLIATLFAPVLQNNNNTIKPTRRQREIDDYLAQSVDRYDLERRERELSRRGYL